MDSEKINKLAKEIHAANVAAGWWDGEVCLIGKVHLITTEICEATEGMRKDLMDDRLPHRKMEEVKLADALIRTLDIGGKRYLRHCRHVEPLLSDPYYNQSRKPNPIIHFCIVDRICKFGMSLMNTMKYGADVDRDAIWTAYTKLINEIINESVRRGFDIESATQEKREYNKQREDIKAFRAAMLNKGE